MGIQNYLKRVSKATKDIKSAIEEKGVSVAQCDGFETLANKVRAIQTGTSSDGSSLFTVLAFKSSQTKPATPTGGSFTTSAISYPSGWSDGSGLSKYVWMSYIVFKGDGSVYKNWVSPILVNGIINDGGDPIDLTDLATRTWVTDQIKNAIKNGVIDLSAYATKSYVDQKISEIPGEGGNFVESINGATGAITFAGSGVSKSGNTFTFNSGSGSGTTTSINGETGELTFTGSGVSKNGKTFTFSGDGGSVDPSTVVTSINDLKGNVTISEGTNITIVKSGKDLKISTTAGTSGEPSKPGKDGDTYVTVQLFTAGSSYETAPEVPNVTSTYDKTTRTVINPPAGWSNDAVKTPENPYIWTIWGTFSESTGNQIGAWTTPKCLTGTPGPKGEDGDEIEEVYALSNESIVPTINSIGTDSNNKNKTEDGYLPKFVFANETKEAISERPSVSSSNRYLFGTKRRKHNGVWLDFSSAYLLANFVEAGLTDEEKEQIKTDVTKDISDEINQAEARVTAVESRVDSIDFTKTTFINDPDNALISAITQYKDQNKKSFADLVVDGKKSEIEAWAGQVVDEKSPTGEQLITKITDAGINLNGAQGVVDEWATYKTEVNDNTSELNTVRNTLNAQQARIEEVAQNTYTDEQLQSKITNYAGTQIDAKAAEINSTVAKSKWIWGVYNNTESPTEILATKVYDITQFTNTVDSSGNVITAPMTEDEYRKTIEGTPWEKDTQNPKRTWTRIAQPEAFSKIIQKTNSLTLAVNEGESWASIVAKANESTGSELCLDANRINLSGTTNATEAFIGKATIQGATIIDGSIANAKINSCTITSKIKSSNYVEKTDTADGQGFLFDAGAKEYAIYGRTPEGKKFAITNNYIEVPAANITNLQASIAQFGFVQAGNIVAKEVNSKSEIDDITKTAIMNADKFSVSVKGKSGESGEIYIGIAPEYVVNEVTYKNMPVLYMTYSDGKGNEYTRYLDPKIWISPTTDAIYTPYITYYGSKSGLVVSTPIILYKKMKNGAAVDNLLYNLNSTGTNYEPYTGILYGKTITAEGISEIPTYDSSNGSIETLKCMFTSGDRSYGKNPYDFQFNFVVPSVTKYTISNGLVSSEEIRESNIYAQIDTNGEEYFIKTNTEIPSDSTDEYPGTYGTSPLRDRDLVFSKDWYKIGIGSAQAVKTTYPLNVTAYSLDGSEQSVSISFATTATFVPQTIAGPWPTNGNWDTLDGLDEQTVYDVNLH